MTREARNLSASIRARLLNEAKARHEEFQNFLMQYARERWLYRLSQSAHRERFVLKGAMLFAVWNDQPHRATQDLDLLGFGSSSIPDLEQAFREICATPAPDDGLEMLADSVKGRAIREENIYDGVRLTLTALLGNARIPLQIDVGFGDSLTPEPELIEYPTILSLPAPHLRAYRRETVIAEKFNAMVELELRNTRLKDFYDLWVLAGTCDFDGGTLTEAIKATFARRRTSLPTEPPVALTAAFSEDVTKQNQWRAFVRRSKLQAGEATLPEVIARLRDFLLLPIEALAAGRNFRLTWKAGGPWKE
jgi:predicted nucleotidyltransferase component of viral defense system